MTSCRCRHVTLAADAALTATGGQTLEKDLLAGKAPRRGEGETVGLGAVPRAEITQISPVRIVQQSAFTYELLTEPLNF